jgi:trimeric autotransporter adhesin
MNNTPLIRSVLVALACLALILVPTVSYALISDQGGIGGVEDGGGVGEWEYPQISYFTASPASVSAGGSATLSWSANVGSCVGTNFTAGWLDGTRTVTPTVTTTYTLTCTNVYGSDSSSVTVTVAAATSDLTAGGVTPSSGVVGTPVSLTTTVSNSGGASTGVGFTNLFQRATDAFGSNATDIGTHTVAAVGASGSAVSTLSYTFPSAQTWFVRVCADKSSAASSGTITESNEGNNCGAWSQVTVSGVLGAPTATITATPSNITSGQSATLSWSSSNATSCTGTGFSTGNQTSGSVSVSPTATQSYSLSCTGPGGTGTANTSVTVATAPTAALQSGKLCSGGTYLGTSYTNACVSYCTSQNASCCSIYYTYGDFADDYTCVAYANTTSLVDAPLTGGCGQGRNGDGGLTTDGGLGPDGNCQWTAKSAALISYGPAVTASLVTNPTSISAGQPALITWTSANATSCTGTNFSTGGATSGSVTVTPSLTTAYTLTCTGAGGTATETKTLTVNVFTVTCSATPNPVTVNQPVSWSSAATGGTGSYAYAWTGSDGLSGTAASLTKTYESLGEKNATLTVTSGSQTITTACTGTPCQQSSCTCTGGGCGATVREGISTDVSAGAPVISTGTPIPGGTIAFSAPILNLGNNSVSSVFQNRFQIDVGNDGSYNVTLDTGGTAGSEFVLGYGQKCTGGTLVATDSIQSYGTGDLSDTIQSMCEQSSASGQCCSATITTQGGNPGGGPGGGGGIQDWVGRLSERNVAAVYKSLALTSYTIDLTVRSGAWTRQACTSEVCYSGTWQSLTGTQFDIPFGQTGGSVSPSWTNIPAGTHKVRMCVDSPTSQLGEVNENNNCGADTVFTVSGFDLTSGTPGVNSGTLLGGQQITFFGSISNTPAYYVATGQCQARVVVAQGGTCSLALSQDQLVWSTSGATIVSTIKPLTSSPTIPQTGTAGIIERDMNTYSTPYYNADPKFFADLALSGLTYGNDGIHTGDNKSTDRICKVVYDPAAWVSAFDVTRYNSCGNNSILRHNGTTWSRIGACADNRKVRYTFKCAKQGSPYTLSGTYAFPTPLAPGTHTYLMTTNACAPGELPAQSMTLQGAMMCSGGTQVGYSNDYSDGVAFGFGTQNIQNECESITPVGGCCSVTVQEELSNGGSYPVGTRYFYHAYTGATLVPADSRTVTGTYTTTNYSYFAGTYTGSCSTSCVASVTVPAQGSTMCSLTPSPSVITSGGSSTLSWETNNASAFSIDNGIGSVTPVGAGSRTVSPTQTTTYTGTVTTNPAVFALTGTVPNQFQIDLGNNGTWDVTLTGSQLSTLGVNQSAQVTSAPWTAVAGTHAIRLCANTPSTISEGNSGNNCGNSFTFTVTPPTQCQDGIDNNGNGLVDLADPACTGTTDTAEETFSDAALSLSVNQTTVRSGASVTLTWTAVDVVAGSCSIVSSTGGTWPVTGAGGTRVVGPVTAETTFSLRCRDMQNNEVVEDQTTVRLAPKFEEI